MSTKLIQNGQQSIQNWEGLQPKKFIGGVRTGYEQKKNELNFDNNFQKQRKHFEPNYSKEYEFKSSIKNFEEDNKGQHFLIDNNLKQKGRQSGKSMVEKILTERPLLHPQKLHLQEIKSNHIEDLKYGKYCQYNYEGQRQNYTVEDMLGQRKMIDTIEQKRNGINYISKGDKPYKTPEYQTGFFESEGLTVGQTHQLKKKTISKLKADLKGIQIQKMNEEKLWKNKQKQEKRQIDEQSLGELDGWVENTLKKANPNYKDPELFFQNLENLTQNVDKNAKKKK